MSAYAEKAWDKTKAKDDPPYAATALDFRENLNFRAAKVIETGTAMNPFEEEVKSLHEKDRKKEKAPLAVTEPQATEGEREGLAVTNLEFPPPDVVEPPSETLLRSTHVSAPVKGKEASKETADSGKKTASASTAKSETSKTTATVAKKDNKK
jgi:hypothetical protein